MKNDLVIALLRNVGDILEIQGESVYKIRAYRKAVETLQEVTEDIEDIVKEGRVKDIPGIGDAIGAKIKEIVETGKMYYLEKISQDMPLEVTSLMRVEGIGGKTAGRLYKELGIKSTKGLEEAIDSGLILKLSGFTEAKVAKIKRSLKYIKSDRTPLHKVEPVAIEIREYLIKTNLLTKVEIGGSVRRKKSTARDIDVHAVGKEANFKKVMKLFTEMPDVDEVIVTGSTKTTIKLKNNLNVDLRLLEEHSHGSGYIHSTGARSHTVKLRTIADKNGLLLNEYGLFTDDRSKLLASETEEDIYTAMGMSFIPPEMREDRGEIEAALEKKLPNLVTRADLKGDLHMHSYWSDGKATIMELVEEAEKQKLEYIAITDYFGKIPVYKPLTKEKLLEQKKEIEQISQNIDLKIIHGLEVDIAKDGSIDVPKEILEEVEFIVASIHSLFGLPEEEMTQRILNAMDNEYVNGIGHPTGRMFGKHPGYKLDFGKLAEKSRETKTFLEINAQPNRQDIDDYIVHDVIKKTPVYIGSDAHRVSHISYLTWGINIARRAWCEKKDLLNCLSYTDLMKTLKR